jgi:hypothetical protein
MQEHLALASSRPSPSRAYPARLWEQCRAWVPSPVWRITAVQVELRRAGVGGLVGVCMLSAGSTRVRWC